jgi:hypothetical protein
LYQQTIVGTSKETVMSQSIDWGNCARCGNRIERFGTMRHVFMDADLQPICTSCARELVPDQVAQAEADDARWTQNDADAKDP